MRVQKACARARACRTMQGQQGPTRPRGTHEGRWDESSHTFCPVAPSMDFPRDCLPTRRPAHTTAQRYGLLHV